MTCSDIREALSARYDGERAGLEPAVVRAHVEGCADCAAFERGLVALQARVEDGREAGPDLVAAVVARSGRRQRTWEGALRWAVGLCAAGELGDTLTRFLQELGLGGHESHESTAFTVALCIGLLAAAFRPRLAAGYVPVLGAATGLLLVSSLLDVHHGEVSWGHESEHLGLALGFVFLCLLAAAGRGWPWGRSRRRRRAPAPYRPALHAVRRVAVPARLVRVAAAVALTCGLVLAAGPASAHAVLEGSTPGQGSDLKQAPPQVVLTYDEPVTLLPTSVRVFAPDGSRVDDGDVGHAGSDATTAAVGLHAAQQGTYLVAWRVISADSHPVSGAFTFSVGDPSAAPTAATLSNDPAVAGLLGLARWVGYAGSALLVGGLLFCLLCWRTGLARSQVRRVLVGGAAALAVGAAVTLLVKGPLDAGLGLSAIGRGSLLREVLGTTFGRATLARLVLALLGSVVVALWRRPRTQAVAAVVLAVAVAASFAAAGHAVAGEQRPLALVSDGLHVLAASTWLGGLVLLGVFAVRTEVGLTAAMRFSRLALTMIVVLAATGAYQAWRQVGAWGAFTATAYGKELLVKLLVVGCTLVVAAGSRWWLWRRLHPPLVVSAATAVADPAPPALPGPGLGPLRRTVLAEAFGIAVVLGITSALVATEPAKTAYHPIVSANLTIEGDLVQVSAVPDGDRTMDLHLYVFGADQLPTDPKQVTASVALPAQDVGPLPVDLAVAGTGHRTGTISVPMTGDWQLAVTVRTTAVDEDTQYVDLPIR